MTTNHLPVQKPEANRSPMALLMEKADTFKLNLAAKAVDFNTFKGAMIGAALRDPKLMDCVRTSPVSVLSCAATCAELGLVPGGPRGEVYLIPRNNKVKRGGAWVTELQCTLIIGYRGLAKLALQHPKVERIQPVIVYKEESFRYLPAHPDMPIEHEVKFGVKRNRDTMIGGYCLGWMRGSRGPAVRLLDMEDFEDARARNQKKEGAKNAWDSDYEAMCLKTLVRRICNLLPTNTDLEKALAVEESDTFGIDSNAIALDPTSPTAGVAALENDERLAMGAPDDLQETEAVPEDEANG